MADLLADIMAMPQGSTCDTCTYRFSAAEYEFNNIFATACGLVEIQLEYFQKACQLCTKMRENAVFELRDYCLCA